MIKKYKIRFAEAADLKSIIKLCELHAIFEKSEYDPTGKEEALNKHLFSKDISMARWLTVKPSSHFLFALQNKITVSIK